MSEPGQPCGLCGVRPDVACSHRPADPDWTQKGRRMRLDDPPARKADTSWMRRHD